MEMTTCFDQQMSLEDAQRCREWLVMDIGKPFMRYIALEAQRAHDGAVNAITDNPIKDILVGQRSIAAEQALLSLADTTRAEAEDRAHS